MVETSLSSGTACKRGQPATHPALKASSHKCHREHSAYDRS